MLFYLAMLFYLFAAHALMDYALQTDAIATCKCRNTANPIQESVPWYYWLTAHALLHGAAVGVVIKWFGYSFETATAFAIAETVIHWFIDLGKCEGRFNIHVDQALHIACKLLWWGLLLAGVIEVRS
jgi:hypothetical protein